VLEQGRTTYWERGLKGGGMEGKEWRRMVVRDRQDGNGQAPLDAVRDRRGSEWRGSITRPETSPSR
jgi:hypothetical protein